MDKVKTKNWQVAAFGDMPGVDRPWHVCEVKMGQKAIPRAGHALNLVILPGVFSAKVQCNLVVL